MGGIIVKTSVIAKYAKMCRKSDKYEVILFADYFHEEAIRCSYAIFIEKKKLNL